MKNQVGPRRSRESLRIPFGVEEERKWFDGLPYNLHLPHQGGEPEMSPPSSKSLALAVSVLRPIQSPLPRRGGRVPPLLGGYPSSGPQSLPRSGTIQGGRNSQPDRFLEEARCSEPLAPKLELDKQAQPTAEHLKTEVSEEMQINHEPATSA